MDLNDMDRAILHFVNVVGIATFTQLQQHLEQTALTLAARPEAVPDPRHAIEQLIHHKYLAVLPFRGRHYSGQVAQRQRVVRLTRLGADLLRAAGIPASVRLYQERPALRHALALVDVHLALHRVADVASVETDRSIYEFDGKHGIRPDNLVHWMDPNRPPTLFETELEAERSTESRLRDKIARLTRFFLSAEGKPYDPEVRVIYLWKARTFQEAEGRSGHSYHDQAMNAWANASYSIRVQRPGRTLPMRLHFISHRIFLQQPETALDEYELLSAAGIEPLGDQPAMADPDNKVGELNIDALYWILGFYQQQRTGIQTMRQLRDQIELVNHFLDWHPEIRIALQRAVNRVAAAVNGEHERRELERLGVIFLRVLGIPAHSAVCNNHLETLFPITPIALVSPGENAALTFVINRWYEQTLLEQVCSAATAEEMSRALARFVQFLIQERSALDLVASRKSS